MNVLEKILEEISEVEKEYVTGHKVLYALGATGMATEISGIIRSHMDEVVDMHGKRLIDANALDDEVTNFFLAITGNPKQTTVVRECKESFRRMIDEQPTVYANNGWIPVSEKLPEDDDMRFYMCIVENHEEDLPMFCQYDGEYGFGFWHDIYDSESLGFVDTEFKTNDELGYEKVVAWQPLPEPYKEV